MAGRRCVHFLGEYLVSFVFRRELRFAIGETPTELIAMVVKSAASAIGEALHGTRGAPWSLYRLRAQRRDAEISDVEKSQRGRGTVSC
jgi:hypothetical protein